MRNNFNIRRNSQTKDSISKSIEVPDKSNTLPHKTIQDAILEELNEISVDLTASELANRNLVFSSDFKHFLCSQTSCCPRLQIGLPGRRIGSEGRSVNIVLTSLLPGLKISTDLGSNPTRPYRASNVSPS